MSWTLLFFRRVGQPELTLEEVQACFARRPEFVSEPGSGGEISFRLCAGPEGTGDEARWVFRLPQDEGTDEGRADFPFEETPLRLLVEYLNVDPPIHSGTALAVELCAELQLLCLDPQSDQEVPLPPRPEVLCASYEQSDWELRETLAHAVRRRRQLLSIAALLLGAALLLLLAPAWLHSR